MSRALAVVLLAVLASPAHADPPSLRGTFGFDWIDPEHSKCVAVKGALLTKLTSKFRCAAPDTGSASGVKVVAMCTEPKRRAEWMVFATIADCRKERDMQLANGE